MLALITPPTFAFRHSLSHHSAFLGKTIGKQVIFYMAEDFLPDSSSDSHLS